MISEGRLAAKKFEGPVIFEDVFIVYTFMVVPVGGLSAALPQAGEITCVENGTFQSVPVPPVTVLYSPVLPVV